MSADSRLTAMTPSGPRRVSDNAEKLFELPGSRLVAVSGDLCFRDVSGRQKPFGAFLVQFSKEPGAQGTIEEGARALNQFILRDCRTPQTSASSPLEPLRASKNWRTVPSKKAARSKGWVARSMSQSSVLLGSLGCYASPSTDWAIHNALIWIELDRSVAPSCCGTLTRWLSGTRRARSRAARKVTCCPAGCN